MARDIPPVNAVRAFEAAARHLQFQNAASELGVTPSALSYQIRQLEEALDVKLFKRLNRAVELTDQGKLIAERITAAFEEMEAAFALLKTSGPDRTLTISTGPAFSAKWLAPRLHAFLEGSPETDFRMSASLKLVDFKNDGIDAAIRFSMRKFPDLYQEALFEEIAAPLISPELYKRLAPQSPDDIFSQATLIHDDSLAFLTGGGQWKAWFEATGRTDISAAGGLHFNHADHCLEAAIDGAGIVMGRLALAFRDIRACRLIAPFKEVMRSKGGFFFCCPQKHLEQEKVLNFLGWLRDEAEDQAQDIRTFLLDKTVLET